MLFHAAADRLEARRRLARLADTNQAVAGGDSAGDLMEALKREME